MGLLRWRRGRLSVEGNYQASGDEGGKGSKWCLTRYYKNGGGYIFGVGPGLVLGLIY